MKVVGVFYKGGEHAKEQPKLLGTIENQLGMSSNYCPATTLISQGSANGSRTRDTHMLSPMTRKVQTHSLTKS